MVINKEHGFWGTAQLHFRLNDVALQALFDTALRYMDTDTLNSKVGRWLADALFDVSRNNKNPSVADLIILLPDALKHYQLGPKL